MTVADENRQVAETGRKWPATDQAFANPYWDLRDPGTYRCANCGKPVFGAAQKFDSGTGWPSFFAPLSQDAVEETPERRGLLRRTRVACRDCGRHLGYRFRDGPFPTGLRYCINGSALAFQPEAAPVSPQ